MGNAIDRIKISGFRRLADIELEMRPFMVLIGTNGAGKTSFLDALSLLSASASGNMSKTLTQLGGADYILTRGKAQDISYCIDIPTRENQTMRYELQITPDSSLRDTITKETLSQYTIGNNSPVVYIDSASRNISYYDESDKKMITPNWNHNYLETSLAQVPQMFVQPDVLRKLLLSFIKYHMLDVGARSSVKMPQPMKPASLPGVNGEDLVPYLYYLREGYPNRYETIIDTLKVAYPDFESLNFPPVAAGMLTMTWSDRKFKNPISIYELSAGTLRFIWLLSLLYSPGLSAITMIDEPEASLHPEQISLLVDAMREASMRTQLIVATQSDSLIRFLQPDEVVVMDIDDEGVASATWADTMDLDAWLSEYSLDEIWHMGSMGGRG